MPISVHTHMVPNSPTADERENSALINTATQAAGMARTEVANASGFVMLGNVWPTV